MGSSRNYLPPPQQVNPNINNPNITMPASTGYQKIKWDGRGGMGGAMRNSMNNLAGQQEWQKQQNYQNDQNMMNAYNAGNTYTPQTIGPSFSSTSNANINPFFGNYGNY